MAAPASVSAPLAAPDRDITRSLRIPILILFVSASIWLIIASAFGLIASIKFHQPNFLADSPLLTYGRARPAFLDSMLYGFCIQAALGVSLWLFVRLGRAPLAQPWLVIAGAKLWNLGVTIGVLGILIGQQSGFEYLEVPGYAAWIMMLGYLLFGIAAVLSFHRRVERGLYVSHWFVLAALFWFPWIFSTAELLFIKYPVRGMAQVAIAWWYVANLKSTFLPLAGLACVFYFIPKLTSHELHSRHLALFTFWVVTLFGGWCGVPNSAPLPAWMPTLSTAMSVLLLLAAVTVALNVHGTLDGRWSKLGANPPLRFLRVGVCGFILAILLSAVSALVDTNYPVAFTWLTPALAQLNYYGFFAMVMFGAIYSLLPRLLGVGFPSPKLVRAHFWLALLGLLLGIVPLGIDALFEAPALNNPNVAFLQVVKGTLLFLRVSTLGDLLLGAGHVLFCANISGITLRFYRPRVVSAYDNATADLFATEGHS